MKKHFSEDLEGLEVIEGKLYSLLDLPKNPIELWLNVLLWVYCAALFFTVTPLILHLVDKFSGLTGLVILVTLIGSITGLTVYYLVLKNPKLKEPLAYRVLLSLIGLLLSLT